MAFIQTVVLIMCSLERVHHLRVVINIIHSLFPLMIMITPLITSIFGKHVIMPLEFCNIFLPTGFNRRYFIPVIILIVLLLGKVLFLVHHVVVIFIHDVLVLDLEVVVLFLLLLLMLMLLQVFLFLLVPTNGLPIWL